MPDEIVGDGKWILQGTENQNAILRPVFQPGSSSFIAFPWARITALPTTPVPISFDDLNDGTFGVRSDHDHHDHHDRRSPHHSPSVTVADGGEPHPVHPHIIDADGNEGHAISRPWIGAGSTGRYMIAGVFWSDGRIKIDIRMEERPDAAREVLSAEIAHAVDYGLPLTVVQKTALMGLFHPGGADAHTWWEVEDYGTEYYSLLGETFMAAWTHAYSPMEPWQDPFVHKSTRAMAPAVHAILGILPVGQAPPPPPPPTTTPAPVAPFVVKARAWRTKIGNAYVELTWTGAASAKVVVRRNGAKLQRTKNDGRFVNLLGGLTGTFAYVLVDGTRRSNEVGVSI